MFITVTGKQVDVGDALRAHVDEALTTAVAKYFSNPVESHITVSREGSFFRADVSVRVGRGIQVQGEASAPEAYAACDGAIEHVAKRLRRHKRWLKDHHKGNGSRDDAVLSAQAYVLAAPSDEELDAENGASGQPAVIAEMTAEIPTLSVSEAVLRLDLTTAPALLFRHASHGGLNMVYRRSDGNIGWVDPDGNNGAAANGQAKSGHGN